MVVVVDDDQPSETEVARQRGRLVADALCQVTVTTDHKCLVVTDVGSEACPKVPFSDGHPDPVGDALAQWAGGDLDTCRMAGLRVAWCSRAPLAEVTKVVEGQAVAGQVEHRIEQYRRVACREDEAVPVRPGGISGVVREHPGPQDMGQWCQGHGGPLVAGLGGVWGVHSQRAHYVNGPLLRSVRHKSHLRPL